jgi:hypothetical protein
MDQGVFIYSSRPTARDPASSLSLGYAHYDDDVPVPGARGHATPLQPTMPH